VKSLLLIYNQLLNTNHYHLFLIKCLHILAGIVKSPHHTDQAVRYIGDATKARRKPGKDGRRGALRPRRRGMPKFGDFYNEIGNQGVFGPSLADA
jgi:hypothetical protein